LTTVLMAHTRSCQALTDMAVACYSSQRASQTPAASLCLRPQPEGTCKAIHSGRGGDDPLLKRSDTLAHPDGGAAACFDDEGKARVKGRLVRVSRHRRVQVRLLLVPERAKHEHETRGAFFFSLWEILNLCCRHQGVLTSPAAAWLCVWLPRSGCWLWLWLSTARRGAQAVAVWLIND